MLKRFSRLCILGSMGIGLYALHMQISAYPNQPLLPGSHRTSEITEFYPTTTYGPYLAQQPICSLDPVACDTVVQNFRPGFWVKFPQIDFGKKGIAFKDKAYIWSACPWGDAGRFFKIVIDSSGDSATMARNTFASILVSWSTGGWDGIDVDSALVSWQRGNITGKHDVYIWALDPYGTTYGGVGLFYAFAFRPAIPNNPTSQKSTIHKFTNVQSELLIHKTNKEATLFLPFKNTWTISLVSATGATVNRSTLQGNSITMKTDGLPAGSYYVTAVSSVGSFSRMLIVSH